VREAGPCRCREAGPLTISHSLLSDLAVLRDSVRPLCQALVRHPPCSNY